MQDDQNGLQSLDRQPEPPVELMNTQSGGNSIVEDSCANELHYSSVRPKIAESDSQTDVKQKAKTLKSKKHLMKYT